MNVYQLVLSEGYTPKQLDIHRHLICFSSKAWKPEWFAEMDMVATVDTTDLDEAFAIMNRWTDSDEAKVTRLAPLHSLSVGDILETDDGKFYLVDDWGFEEIEVITDMLTAHWMRLRNDYPAIECNV